MKLLPFFIVFSFLMFIGCQQKKTIVDSNPLTYLSKDAQLEFKYRIVRYFDKLPKKVSHENKFDAEYDSIYKLKAQNADLYHYYISEKTKEIYFAVTRIAPSIKLKKVATIGKLTLNDQDSIVSYEEICRTWKMEEEELKEKTAFLFNKVVNNEDLTPYYTLNSQPEFYIEFPDEKNVFDVSSRSWIFVESLD